MEHAAVSALVTLLSFQHLFYLAFGVFLGMVIGILPGLGGTSGLALLLPFVFNMEPSKALAMMIGLQSVTATSDTFPAILMGIPGTASAQATVMDGFPLSKKGQAARALSAGFSASLLGGLFGALVLSFAIYYAEPIMNAMGFSEQMMLIVLALTTVGMLTGSHPLKGLAACTIGLMIGAFGAAPVSGVERLTFGTEYLVDPIKLVIVGLAMFAMPEIVDLLRRQVTISESGALGVGSFQGIKDTLSHWWIVLRCACIGCLIGALPGLGGSVIDWIAYGHVVQTSKDRKSYGTGDIRGVIAPEAANNAKEGGALIPTILFGIPGSGSMALLLGGFVLIGIDPGIDMITNHLNLVYVMIWSVALANILGAGTCLLLAPQIAKLTTIRYTLIAPFMFGLIFFAALGTLGVYMKRFGWPRPALLIGYVLSTRVETSIYHTITTYGFTFLSHPIVIVLIVITLISIVAAVRFRPHQEAIVEDGVHAARNLLPQSIFCAAVIALAVVIIYDGARWDFLTGIYPLVAGSLCLLFMIPLSIEMWRTKGAAAVFYDSEREEVDRAVEARSNEYYLLWLVGMLVISALVGFVLGVGIFIYLFVRLKGGLSRFASVLSAGAFILLLGLLSHFMTLMYPEGLLQSYVTLPWPLQ